MAQHGEMDYVRKKLQPLREKEKELKDELEATLKLLKIEEADNDLYFEEIQKFERDIYKQQQEIEEIKKQFTRNRGENNTGELDQQLEERIKLELNKFLLQKSKKEIIEEQIIRKKIHKKYQDGSKEDSYDDTNHVVLVSKGHDAISKINIPPNIVNFEDFRMIMGLYYGVNEKEIFLTDRFGNLLLPHMNILESLYPPVYTLLHNFVPKINVLVKRPEMEVKKEKRNRDNNNNQMIKPKMIKKQQFKEETFYFDNFRKYAMIVKHVVEQILFCSMIIIFVLNYFNASEFQKTGNFYNSMMEKFQFQKNYDLPLQQIAPFIEATIYEEADMGGDPNFIFPTLPMKKGLVKQVLAEKRPINECFFTLDIQKQVFENKNQTCINYAENSVQSFGENSYEKYDPHYDGFVYEIDLSSRANFNQTYSNMLTWLQYYQSQVSINLNYLNAPANYLAIVEIIIFYVSPEGGNNRVTVNIEIINLNQPSLQDEALFNQLFVQSLCLILFALIGTDQLYKILLDIFGIYPIWTTDKIIQTFIRYKQNLQTARTVQEKIMKKKGTQKVILSDNELVPKPNILDDFIITKIRNYYFAIKKPTVFEYNFIFACVLVSTQQQISQQLIHLTGQINEQSDKFIDNREVIYWKQINQAMKSAIILMLMFSVSRFLGIWNLYLFAYGQTLVKFIKYSWFQIVISVFILSMFSLAWIFVMQGDLDYHYNFIYILMGLVRSSQNSGIFQNVSSFNDNTSYIIDIIFKPELQMIQLITLWSFNFLMYPIFSALLTQFVHDTKEEIEQSILEREEKRLKELLEEMEKKKKEEQEKILDGD